MPNSSVAVSPDSDLTVMVCGVAVAGVAGSFCRHTPVVSAVAWSTSSPNEVVTAVHALMASQITACRAGMCEH